MIETDCLLSVLQEQMSRHIPGGCKIAELSRTPHARQSSFQLERLRARLADGRELGILFKNVGPRGLLPDCDQQRTAFPYDPLCEIRTYRELLTPELGAPFCFGIWVDERSQRYWLFLEDVAGMELVDIGDIKIWEKAVLWLTQLHGLSDDQIPGWVFRYDSDYYHTWVERAVPALARVRSQWRLPGEGFERVVRHYDQVVRHLMTLPRSIIHGEFYPSNILISRRSDGGLRICVVDWGTTAIGPRLLDLASLVSGKWTNTQRLEFADTYRRLALPGMSPKELKRSLAFCRLHLSMQWLASCVERPVLPPLAQQWIKEAEEVHAEVISYL